MTSFHTIPELAKALRIGSGKVRRLIERGELAAVNVGMGSKRPRYVVAPDALASFLTRRSVIPETPRTHTRRPKLAASVKHFD